MIKAQIVLATRQVGDAAKEMITVALVYPAVFHSHVLSYRMLCLTTPDSLRSIPTLAMMDRIKEHPYVPEAFGISCEGQSPKEYHGDHPPLISRWRLAMENALSAARSLMDARVHKETTNRVMAPYFMMRALVTAPRDEWNRFIEEQSQPYIQSEMRTLAAAVKAEFDATLAFGKDPTVSYRTHHLPYISKEEFGDYGPAAMTKVSYARCLKMEPTLEIQDGINIYKRFMESKRPFAKPAEHLYVSSKTSRGVVYPHWQSFRHLNWIQ